MSDREDCVAFEEDLSAWIDGELDAPRASAVQTHVAACGACRRRTEALRAIDVGLQRLDTDTDPARIARIHEAIAARLQGDDAVVLPLPRRAPPPARRWVAPLVAGTFGAAAAASLVLLLQTVPTSAPEPAARERVVAARELAAAPASPPPELRVVTQKNVDAFAKSGASAVDDAAAEGKPAAPLELDSARDLEMIERIASLSEAERRKLDRNLARWEALSAEERDRLRAQWRPAAAEPAPTQ